MAVRNHAKMLSIVGKKYLLSAATNVLHVPLPA